MCYLVIVRVQDESLPSTGIINPTNLNGLKQQKVLAGMQMCSRERTEFLSYAYALKVCVRLQEPTPMHLYQM